MSFVSTAIVTLALMAPALGTEDRALEHNGQARTYRVHTPTSFAGKPVPLVLVLHGAGANGKITEAVTGFTELSDTRGFAVVYPDGLSGVWRFLGSDRPALKAKSSDDVGFIRELMDQMVTEGIADPHRVYVTGISNGAYMSNRLAWDLSDRIAAIAPVAGTLPKVSESAKPPRAMPVVYFHGTDDRIVGIDGRDTFSKQLLSLSAERLVTWWARCNGCEEMPEVETLADATDDGTTVERKVFRGGATDAPVVYYEIHGGGHTWPGGSGQPEAVLGKTCHDINASEIIWDFFAQHTLPEQKEKK